MHGDSVLGYTRRYALLLESLSLLSSSRVLFLLKVKHLRGKIRRGCATVRGDFCLAESREHISLAEILDRESPRSVQQNRSRPPR